MTAISACRVCGNRSLIPVIDLGDQALTSIFPRSRAEVVPTGPLDLVRCSPDGCGLVQLRHTADLTMIHGDHYEYRSGIRPYMINHLRSKVEAVLRVVDLESTDLVLDIGSNDSTLLQAYPSDGPTLVGVDPTGEKLREFYPPHIELIPDFFTREKFQERYGDRKAKIVTSIAMFYNLPDPMGFMRDVHAILADDGVWMIEVSNLTSMIDATAYDVMCHEHLELYALRQIEWMADRVGFTVVRAEITEVYNGSLCVILAKSPTRYRVDEAGIEELRRIEAAGGLDTMAPFEAFATRVRDHRDQLREFLDSSRKAGRLTVGYGASIKGNVILQYCGLTEEDLPCIGEVSPGKAGGFSPGSGIPVVTEEEAKALGPDQLLVLPWIYRAGFVERETEFMAGGGKLVFALPTLDIVTAK
ncbi:class I SAM-dependent methyltransferase [Streptomyces profundus]|uniref:class I SAM-dependent methyltransferase n=1 Tax=Streptomyces profundus TaxID=2867410 RepID=UPI001D16D630|nr:class I SAM-dependent methyltransferase [Streptomyces sp. MA3_2.13]UED87203.1 class I SAM-dependent methyltransferase [Streptomyces sp. MA3_2.13]